MCLATRSASGVSSYASRPFRNPREKVRVLSGPRIFAARQVNVLESSPPLRKIPTGTSATSWRRTESSSNERKRSSQSSSRLNSVGVRMSPASYRTKHPCLVSPPLHSNQFPEGNCLTSFNPVTLAGQYPYIKKDCRPLRDSRGAKPGTHRRADMVEAKANEEPFLQ